LRRTANIISQDSSFSAGAQVAHNILCGLEEGTARSVPQAAENDASFFTGP
jgi:hypothetical protein